MPIQLLSIANHYLSPMQGTWWTEHALLSPRYRCSRALQLCPVLRDGLAPPLLFVYCATQCRGCLHLNQTPSTRLGLPASISRCALCCGVAGAMGVRGFPYVLLDV